MVADADDVRRQLEGSTPGRVIVWPPEGGPRPIADLRGTGTLRIALDRLLPPRPDAEIEIGLIFDEQPSPFRAAARRNLARRAIVMTFPDTSKLGLGLPPAVTGAEAAIWSPSSSGQLAERDLAEAARLADHLGRWVELLPDDDPRLPEAEATRNALDAELRLDQPRRGMLRAIVQSGLDLLRAEVDELTAAAAGLLGEPMDPGRWIVPMAPPVDVPITEPDEAADEQWRDVSDQLSDLAEAAADQLPDDELPSGPPDADGEPSPPGRGTVLMKWIGKEGAAAVVRGAAWAGTTAGGVWVGENGPTVVAKVVESLLNLVGI